MPSTKQSDFLSATYTGPQGPQGPQGATGSTGSTGPQGPQGPSSMSDGTAAAPGLPFADNTATGFYRPAANTLGFVTASVERMRIDSSGNLTGATISAPVLSGTATGTYTLGGTPSLAATALTGTLAAARLPAGSVLQVVNAIYASQSESYANAWIDTGLTVSITPTKSSSKIFVMASLPSRNGGTSDVNALTTIFRDSTNLGNSTWGLGTIKTTSIAVHSIMTMTYLDSPATTSSTTYKVSVYPGGVQFQWCGAGSHAVITVMEIAA